MTREKAIEILEAIYFIDEEKQKALSMAIEALEQPYGKWYSYIRFRMNNWENGYGCTCCKEWSAKESNYCPNCGARMRKGESNG